MRPKPPKLGKRVLLERVTFIWNRLSFLRKVSFRNIFRYKNRFVMMVLGIGGCMALLVTGFGIYDSVKEVVNYQYDEILKYEYAVTFQEDQDEEKQKAFTEEVSEYAQEVMFLGEYAVETATERGMSTTSLLVIDREDISSFIDLHLGTQKVSLPKTGEVCVSKRLSEYAGVKIGDLITFQDEDLNMMTLKVSGIFDNYVYNYLIINEETFAQEWDFPLEKKAAYITLKTGSKASEGTKKIMDADDVANVSSATDMRNMIEKMMSALDYIIVLIVGSAGALAFIVLYNLSNINIMERIREVATVKVLGFYANETASYVLRENFFLTAIGVAFGAVVGKIFHAFVMSQIRVDLMSFDTRIALLSYLYSAVLTFAFYFVIEAIMSRKLQKINMAESLKSIE